ncbi:MAG: aldolase/citrate lyase family protein [Lachnoclostridium edouardi]|uniref:HpcH/HpaI aldolase family protein n=1 Tax=Lachnoclostridium edouardi TaxID=1926283 RepID=UPI0026DCE785|nr:aldolase/citrate lyase family protein [Lachnoclostridium edouardi]MDO4278265.1 aldolase/citrate lyase family protein [Lachnoclostridium edouardi]
MQSILTTNEIREFHQKGLKQIFVDQMPVLTDLAREELNRYGMEIIINSGRKTEPKTETFTLSGGKVPFRQLICSDKKLIGTFIGTPHPVMTEFVGHLGFDFVTIDAEHNAMHLETVQKMLQSLKASSTYGMVRVPVLSYEAVSGALDIGADALLIPQIRTMEDINKLKQFSQYPPIGRRGAGPSRLWDYGDSIGNLAGEDPNYTTNIIVQLETVQAVENIDQIVESDFIDMFFIGPGDLSMDMGIFGQFGHPKLVETIMLLREKTKKAGKRLGIFAGNFEAAKSWYEKGFDMTIINSELAIMGTAISQNMTQLREAIGEPL